MNLLRSPLASYTAVMAVAPAIFAVGLILFYSDRMLGEPLRVQGGGAAGLAANLSMAGLTALLGFIVHYGPHLMVLIGLALPVIGALYIVDRVDRAKIRMTSRKRGVIWMLACGETAALLAAFILVFETYPI